MEIPLQSTSSQGGVTDTDCISTWNKKTKTAKIFPLTIIKIMDYDDNNLWLTENRWERSPNVISPCKERVQVENKKELMWSLLDSPCWGRWVCRDHRAGCRREESSVAGCCRSATPSTAEHDKRLCRKHLQLKKASRELQSTWTAWTVSIPSKQLNKILS